MTHILNLNLGSCCFFASLLHQLRGPTAPSNPAHSVHGQQQHQLHTPHHWQQQEWAQPRVYLGQHQNFLTIMFHSWNWVLITSHKPFSPSSLSNSHSLFPYSLLIEIEIIRICPAQFQNSMFFLDVWHSFASGLTDRKKLLWCLFGVQISFKISLIHVSTIVI